MDNGNIPVVFLRLEGPLQSWGAGSVFRTRDTARQPTKSGVLGLIACCMGLSRGDDISDLRALRMGVRVDRPGALWRDYHTVGAGSGIMSAQGKIKKTQATGELETLPTERFYLCDASFLVALTGPRELLSRIEQKLRNPVWPPYLGRKSCVPSAPVCAGRGEHASLTAALEAFEWRPGLASRDHPPKAVRCVVECEPSEAGAAVRLDDPVSFAEPRPMRSRFVLECRVRPPHGQPTQRPYSPAQPRRMRYDRPAWKAKRLERSRRDRFLCVFCGVPSSVVHHVTYERAGCEDVERDLRSVCWLCHDAITMLEGERGMGLHRVDPASEDRRELILRKRAQIEVQRKPHHARRRR